MTSRTATWNATDNFGVFHVGRQTGIGHSSSASTIHPQHPKTAVGLISMDKSVKMRTDCQLYRRGRCHYGEQCKYKHILPSETFRNAEPLSVGLRYEGNPSNSSKYISEKTCAPAAGSHSKSRNSETLYPVRNGAADCQYYLKTGKCNYGSRCKFNHPFRDESLVNALNRRDCFDFVQKGTCPYGKSCKYNHPSLQEELLRSLEHRSEILTDSSDSSPRSVSLNLPQRIMSETLHSTRKEGTGRLAGSKLTRNGPETSRSAGLQHQAASKWEFSSDSVSTAAKKLSLYHQERLESQNSRNSHEICALPTHIGNPWSYVSRESGISQQVNARPHDHQKQLLNGFPADSAPSVRPHPMRHRATSRVRCEMMSSDFQLDDRTPPGDQLLPPAWYDREKKGLSKSVGGPSNTYSGMIALDTGRLYSTKAMEAQEAWSMAWKNNVAPSERQSVTAATNELLDYSRLFDYSRTPASQLQSRATSSKPGIPERRSDISQDLRALQAEQGKMQNGSRVVPSTSTPLSFMSYRFPQAESGPGSLRRTIWNPWEVQDNCGDLENEIQRMEKMRRQHIQVERSLFRRQQEQQGNGQHGQLLSNDVERASSSSQRPTGGDKELPTIRRGFQGEHNYMSNAELELKLVNREANREHSKKGYDLAGYGACTPAPTAHSSLGFDGMVNVWKPTDKSSMFGPGLFGMQHHV